MILIFRLGFLLVYAYRETELSVTAVGGFAHYAYKVAPSFLMYSRAPHRNTRLVAGLVNIAAYLFNNFSIIRIHRCKANNKPLRNRKRFLRSTVTIAQQAVKIPNILCRRSTVGPLRGETIASTATAHEVVSDFST